MTTPGDALSASAAAGTAAGSGASDGVCVACKAVRVGMFFDGTGNSRDFVGTNNIDSWHSNVDLLQRFYKDTDALEWADVNGVSMQQKFGTAYVRGVGIEVGGGNQQWGIPRGLAWGTGPEGVAARTTEGLDTARQIIRDKGQGLELCNVWLDAFGFSRGACVARDFANKVKAGEVQFAGLTAEVKFVGIWDTVSSIGNAGNMGNWPRENVRINTHGTAEYIVHITAKDELRENFPLTLALGGKRIAMVGSHSDIGGGYAPGTNSGVVSYSGNVPFFETVGEKWNLTLGAWDNHYSARSRESAEVHGDKLSEMIIASHGVYSHTRSFHWEAEHGLQFVSLKLMHDQALEKDVPLDPWANSIEGISVSFSGPLQGYYDDLKNAPHRSDFATELAIRQRYAHMSVGNSIGMGPEPEGVRRISTM